MRKELNPEKKIDRLNLNISVISTDVQGIPLKSMLVGARRRIL